MDFLKSNLDKLFLDTLKMADRIQSAAKRQKVTRCCAVAELINSLYLNEKLSDVCFVVGQEKEKFIAHRFILAAQSKMLENMFYGELKDTNYEIKAQHLSPVGFRNMLKYLYTKKVEEIDLSEVYPTYQVADYYCVDGLLEDLTDHITKNCLDVSNCCLIYDQLVKLAISDSLTRDVKCRIAIDFSAACASDSFQQIDKDTMVSILKFDRLNIAELDLLKVCMRWTDSEVVRQGLDANQASKRATFEAIKHLIRFNDLSFSDFASIREIDNYVTEEEGASIFFHLCDPNKPIQIDYRSPRGPYKTKVAKGIKSDTISWSRSITFDVAISVNKTVRIASIKTFPVSDYAQLSVEVNRDNEWAILDCDIVDNQDESFTIDFTQTLELNCKCELLFSFTAKTERSWGNHYNHSYNLNISREMNLSSDEGGVVFKIESESDDHCIESINFYGPFD